MINNIFEQMYFGRDNPPGSKLVDSDKLQACRNRRMVAEHQLREDYGENVEKSFNEYYDTSTAIEDAQLVNAYKSGFKDAFEIFRNMYLNEEEDEDVR